MVTIRRYCGRVTDTAPETVPATPSIPAGWYPNPESPGQPRWWDGTGWTDQLGAPAYSTALPVAQLTAPPGTSVHTVWIWFVLLLPLLRLVPWAPVDFSAMGGAGGAGDPTALLQAELAVFTQPAYLASIVIGLIITGGTVACAALDWRALVRRGVPAPFHWAFAFSAVVSIFCVYPIGRAVVTRRRTGRRSNVLVIAIIVQGLLIAATLSNVTSLLRFSFS